MVARFPKLESMTYRVDKRSRDGVELPGGTFDGVELRLTAGDRWLSYTFSREAPYTLVEMVASDGTTYRVTKCERIPYWEMNIAGGETWLPAAVR